MLIFQIWYYWYHSKSLCPTVHGQTIYMMLIFISRTHETSATINNNNKNPPQQMKWMQIEKEPSRGYANEAGDEDPSMGPYVTQKSSCIVVSCLSMYLFTCLLVALLFVRFPLIIAAISQTKASSYMGHRIWAYDLCVFWFLCLCAHHAQHINKAQ